MAFLMGSESVVYPETTVILFIPVDKSDRTTIRTGIVNHDEQKAGAGGGCV
jgi:hypothetical protein